MIGKEIFEKLKAKYKNGDKFRILFCPYKEDMFDCMDTIYDAASYDDETETTIMPIPYFKLENGLPTSIQMEFGVEFSDYGDKYQKNFPTILNRGWDCIVIHNQYDQYNNVTRLLLTSLILKQFCKYLVFIGYAVVGDRNIEREEIHFPMFKNADLIICENDKHAKQIAGHLNYYGWNTETVGWGNPKYDKLDMKYGLPKEWEEKTNGRKKILLQTSLVPFLQNPGEKLKQIEHIIDYYFEDDSVCLWWRPHPLLKTTIKAHCQMQYDKFIELENRIKNSRHILDMTNNCHRAIVETDEMISDKSSMVVMYKHTGKPITMLEEL